ncbi:tRNA lysidine(34) synthetase TilS [Gammaproteobacteria bacterium]|nr:tRNA lysidine(34) synthetase TilS [Gammaproteobacteria bacterium]MDB2628891.1 tRNA lysidine(34) synthetase TilS [Gammaproteobacteria bacterium]MDC1013623.1 tRNA lysidine(34) synthetase TilS [Gammaproteobacteria bacterium]
MFDRKAFFDLVDPNKNITVGFSGGGDSSALLHFCHQLNQQGLLRGNLSAIHINHSLHKNSDQWESHCKIFCKNRGIAFKSYVVNIDSKKSGLESAARNARYKIFEEVIKSNDQLLMAHHADDVAETILFRLFRGTGLDGLQGPINKRTLGEGVILRPWLAYTKADLSRYLSINDIEFMTDDTNFEDSQDRNYIRNKVLKIALSRWPNASKQIQQMAELVSKHKKTHDFFLHKQFGEKMEGLKLQRSFLLNLEEEICIEVIRYWIKLNNVAMPNKKIISEILKAFIYSNPTPKTQVHWSRADNEQKSAFLTFCDGDLVLNKK